MIKDTLPKLEEEIYILMAHYDQIQNKKHSLIDHLISTGQICQELGARIGLAKTSYLLGILHDIGKADRKS